MASLKIIFSFSTVVFCFCVGSEAREFIIDGENNLWAVPSSVDEFNKWAEKTCFQIGDSLVLKYYSKTDSVLEVTEEDYKICNNANPIKSHHDGETTVSLEKSATNLQRRHLLLIITVTTTMHRAPALTNGGTGLKVTEGFICGTATVGSLAPSPHHHHHHYHTLVQASTNGGTGLKVAEGFVCGTGQWKVWFCCVY
ncbi:early nodulin-like protein 1 [Olea europaea var. sylvestris]|uniref:early nodulin-like protein 1 n=1 Tax=Olea europaea var. sylvestris TaxID=158386 RepID=UPI000C1CD77E|nr:early nodulin-like protein 1 [Olea europaea var. sylvestris]